MTLKNQNQKSDIYKNLCEMAGKNLIQLKECLDFFNTLCAKEIFHCDESYKMTCEIIQNLKGALADEKREYLRLKAISEGN